MAAPRPEGEPEATPAPSMLPLLDAERQFVFGNNAFHDSAFHDIARLAALVCRTPVAILTLAPREEHFVSSELAVDVHPILHASEALVPTVRPSDVLSIADAAADTRFAHHPLVTGDPYIRLLAGITIFGSEGEALGTLEVMDTVPRDLASNQSDALRLLSRLSSEKIAAQTHHDAQKEQEVIRARAQADMQESDVRLRIITDSLPVLISYVDAQQRYRYINAAYEQWLQKPAQEVAGKTMREVMGSKLYQKNLPYIEAALKGQQESYEREQNWPDGKTRFVKGNYVPCLGAQGQIEGFAVIVTDLTDRVRTERLLEETQQRHRSLFHHHPDAVYSFNLTYEFVSANPACEAVSGYTPEELIGTPFLPLIVSQELQHVLECFAAAAEGQPQHFETTIIHKQGHHIEVDVTNVPIVVGGEVIGVYGIAQDISARKQAETHRQQSEAARHQQEEQLRAVVEQAMDGIFLFDPRTYRVLTTNTALQEMLGYTESEAATLTLFDLIAEDRESIDGNVATVLRNRDAFLGERHYRRKDGAVLSVDVRVRIIHYGEIEVFCATVHDNSERKALEVERKILEAERERALEEALARADQDSLTGLFNHRAFHRKLGEEAARAQREGTTLAVAMLDLDNFKFFNDVYGHLDGDGVLRLVAERLLSVCRSYDTVARFGGDEFALLLPGVSGGTAGEVEARLRAAMQGLVYQPRGQEMTLPVSVSVGVALMPQEGKDFQGNKDPQEIVRQADERLLWAKTGGGVEADAREVRASVLKRVQGFSMLDALVTAVDNKDRYTRRHSEDVMAYSLLIARQLGMTETQQQTVAVAALLHDVGKIGVPDKILRKPGRLTEDEFAAILQHPQMGAIMVQAVPGLEDTLDAVRHHHERWDGAGYPFGLKGEETALIARLMAVADAFSAMTTDRPYRKGMTREKALLLLVAGADFQWDAKCVDAFLAALPQSDQSAGAN